MIFRTIPNKREFLARAFGKLGVLDLLERTLARRRPGLIILTHHRIGEPDIDRFYGPVISATPDGLRAQVAWLHDRVRLITLDELIDQVESGSPWPEPVMLLTFDDGYRDNFELAAPILRERNVPATFFIPSGFLEAPRLPWWDHIAYVIKQTSVMRFVLDCSPRGGRSNLEIDLRATSRTAAITTIVSAFLTDAVGDESWFLDRLTEYCMVEVDSEKLGRELFMSWAHVRDLANSNTSMTIGSHAHSHRKLAALDQDTQRDELAASKRILEVGLGHPVKALAYPYGWAGTYTTETKNLAAEAGYLLAFSSREGINHFADLDRYDVRRLGLGSADSVALLRARCILQCSFGKSFL